MSDKRSPCCARLAAQLTRQKADVSRLARRASTAQAQGRPVEKWTKQIERAKAEVVTTQEIIDSHEADHALEVPA